MAKVVVILFLQDLRLRSWQSNSAFIESLLLKLTNNDWMFTLLRHTANVFVAGGPYSEFMNNKGKFNIKFNI